MKRTICLIAVLLLISITAAAGWNDMPEHLYTKITLRDWQGTPEVLVTIADWSLPFLEALLDDSDLEDIRVVFDMTELVCTNKWSADSRILYIGIVPFRGKEGDAYFWPTSIVFTQDHYAWEVDYDDCMIGFSDNFSGRVYGLLDGFICLPAKLDWNREFTIWYDDTKTTFGPLLKDSSSR